MLAFVMGLTVSDAVVAAAVAAVAAPDLTAGFAVDAAVGDLCRHPSGCPSFQKTNVRRPRIANSCLPLEALLACFPLRL
jgi:hypothetical protein